MKIEIIEPQPPFTRGYEIRYNGKRATNVNEKMFQYDFSEYEIFYLLGEKEYKKFENGKYEFNVPVWKLNAISGCFVAKDSYQNKWSYEFTQL